MIKAIAINFDSIASINYNKSIGRPISQIKAQIAAIAFSHHATLATRNVTDFEECGVNIVNPWK